MSPRDDYEDTRREQAAAVAGLQADVRRIDGRIDKEHDCIESVSLKCHETARAVHEIDVQAERNAGRITGVEVAVETADDRSKINGACIHDIQLKQAEQDGRAKDCERKHTEGSRRMGKIELRIEATEAKQNANDRRMAWYAGALTAGAFLAPFIGDLLKTLLIGR